MENDARAFPRYEVDAQAECFAAGASSSYPIQNLSLGGICIRSSVLADVGSRVEVVLRLPELGLELRLEGEVVWVNRTPPQDVGIRWVALDADRRAVLSRYLDFINAGLQAPGA
jgi:hypothetical protein